MMVFRLASTNKVRGIEKHRAALGMPNSGLLPKELLSHGFAADGFPPPHVLPNASWHLSTFMPPEDVLHKVRYAAHTECNVPPFNTLGFQQAAQRTCSHFCARDSSGAARAGAVKGTSPSPIPQTAALGPDAYPPALCDPEYARYAPREWCAQHGGGRGRAAVKAAVESSGRGGGIRGSRGDAVQL